MRIAGVNPCSLVNGDGIRYTIFTQGCFHQCKGCQNKDTWDPKGGYETSITDLAADILKRWKQGRIDGVTLSGGDPYYQQTDCRQLLKLLPRELNVWIYTGFEYEKIKDLELTSLADVIVDGPFIPSKRCEGKPYGSSNQRIIHIYDKKIKAEELSDEYKRQHSFKNVLRQWRETRKEYDRMCYQRRRSRNKGIELVEFVELEPVMA